MQFCYSGFFDHMYATKSCVSKENFIKFCTNLQENEIIFTQGRLKYSNSTHDIPCAIVRIERNEVRICRYSFSSTRMVLGMDVLTSFAFVLIQLHSCTRLK